MQKQHYIAVDCGSSNGKLIDVAYDGTKITIEDSLPFSYEPVTILNAVYNNMIGIMYAVQNNLRTLVAKHGAGAIRSVGVTTWGSEYALLDENGCMLRPMRSNRDEGSLRGMDEIRRLVSPKEFFLQTGSVMQSYSGPVELFDDKANYSAAYNAAKTLLPTADLLGYFFSGEYVTDETMISTLCCSNREGTKINEQLLGKLGLRTDFFPRIVKPGTRVGKLAPAVGAFVGDKSIDVVCCAGHDTPSGLAPVYGIDNETGFISMGTVMLAGGETTHVDYTDGLFEGDFRVVKSVGDRYAAYRDVQGFWVLNQCMKSFQAHGEKVSFDELEAAARKLPKGRCIINLNDPVFYFRGTDMVERIVTYCRETGQYEPQTPADVYRCLMDSYAVAARNCLEEYAAAAGKTIKKLVLFNGGCQCDLLSETISEFTGLPIKAGIRYATALGAATLQMLAAGEFKDMTELKQAMERSFEMKDLSRQKDPISDEVYERFLKLRRKQ